jgi:hypothetical protein
MINGSLSPLHKASSGCRRRNSIQYGGYCEYIEYAVTDSRQGVVLGLARLGEVLKTPHRKNRVKLRNVQLECGSTEWIDLAQDTDRWREIVNAVMNFRVP